MFTLWSNVFWQYQAKIRRISASGQSYAGKTKRKTDDKWARFGKPAVRSTI
jgi:hypothetical protein